MINLLIETRHTAKVFTIHHMMWRNSPNNRFSMLQELREKLIQQIVTEIHMLRKKEIKYNLEITITKKLSTLVFSELLNLKMLKSFLVSKTKKRNYRVISHKHSVEFIKSKKQWFWIQLDGMSFEINIKQNLPLKNQIGVLLSENQLLNKIRIRVSITKNNLIKTNTRTNKIITTKTTINLREAIRITKTIKEEILTKTKITNPDIKIKTTTTIKVTNRTISFLTSLSKSSNQIIKILIIRSKPNKTLFLSHSILHLHTTRKEWLLLNLAEPPIKNQWLIKELLNNSIRVMEHLKWAKLLNLQVWTLQRLALHPKWLRIPLHGNRLLQQRRLEQTCRWQRTPLRSNCLQERKLSLLEWTNDWVS